MDLPARIRQYYFDNFSDLPPSKQFHFASRLAAWEGNQLALSALVDLKKQMVSEDIPDLLEKIIKTAPRKVYGNVLRQPYFAKYPNLFGWHEALFRVRHLKEIYGIDARQDFLDLVGEDQAAELYQALAADDDALRILSRFAIDYIFLYEILFEKTNRLAVDRLLKLCEAYPPDDNTQTHLQIYLLTHAIIADSNFYIRPLPSERAQIYNSFLKHLEALITNKFTAIRFDNKFEFLVASRIGSRDSHLFEPIGKEAAASLSSHGTFIIDQLIGNEQAGLNSFSRSEHRNVLFIMSSSAYRHL